MVTLGFFFGWIGTWLSHRASVAGKIRLGSGTILMLLGLSLLLPQRHWSVKHPLFTIDPDQARVREQKEKNGQKEEYEGQDRDQGAIGGTEQGEEVAGEGGHAASADQKDQKVLGKGHQKDHASPATMAGRSRGSSTVSRVLSLPAPRFLAQSLYSWPMV